MSSDTKTQNTNPLLQESSLAFGAFPFQKLQIDHFAPALDEGIKIAENQLNQIKNIPIERVNFENTLLALETAAESVHRVSSIFSNLLSAETTDKLQELAKDFLPRLASFSNDILLDEKIFSRIETLWSKRNNLSLNAEQMKLLEKTHRDFVRNGALLPPEKKEILREIDQKKARLEVDYSDNILKAVNSFQMILTEKEDVAGLPENILEMAHEAAVEAGLESNDQNRDKKNLWLFTLHGPSFIPFMTFSSRRDLRERLWRAFNSRGLQPPYDNKQITCQIAQLRHQRAELLGFTTHAHFVLEERMAKDPDTVFQFLNRIFEKAKPAAIRDLNAVQELQIQEASSADNPSSQQKLCLMPWDYAYYSERLKNQHFNFDFEKLRPFFPLDKVLNGAFEHARRLYNIEFIIQPNIPGYHTDVRVYEVIDQKSKRHLGLLYTDFFPRKGKRGGAWMTSFREQGLQNGKIERPHISIVCNFTKPTDTKPSLLSFEEVQTLFHEFGHALHGLLSDVTYVSLAGTNVYWDFVELPSQLMENWTLEKDSLDLFAQHYETGEKIPREWTQKIKATAQFQAGYFAIRQLAFAYLDMAWHSQNPISIQSDQIEEFEEKTLQNFRLFPVIKGTAISTSFSHIFAGGYSAGYYSYKWAEVLDADTFELFLQKGLFNQEVASSFRKNILSQGGTAHPMELYKAFRGREPDPDALLRREGLLT